MGIGDSTERPRTAGAARRPSSGPRDHGSLAPNVLAAGRTPEPVPVVASDTRKNRVLIHEDRVLKTFKPSRKSLRNHRRELAALGRLEGLAGVPAVLAVEPAHQTVVLSRVPGRPLTELESVPDSVLLALQGLIEAVLERGVARHSLPPRDVLVDPDGSVGLVDFERTTCRRFRVDPVWMVARMVTRFHLMRLVHGRAPHLLTGSERLRLRAMGLVRAVLQGPDRWKRKLLRALRRA